MKKLLATAFILITLASTAQIPVTFPALNISQDSITVDLGPYILPYVQQYIDSAMGEFVTRQELSDSLSNYVRKGDTLMGYINQQQLDNTLIDYALLTALTPYVTLSQLDSQLDNYVTTDALDTLDIELPDNVLTAQTLVDYYQFATFDSAMFVYDGFGFDSINGCWMYIDDKDTLWKQVYQSDFQNFTKWFNENVSIIFPVNYDFGWGELWEQ